MRGCMKNNLLGGCDCQGGLLSTRCGILFRTRGVIMPYDFHSKLTIQVGFYVSFDRTFGLAIRNGQPGFVQFFQPRNEGPKDHEQAIENELEFGIFNLRHKALARDFLGEVVAERR